MQDESKEDVLRRLRTAVSMLAELMDASLVPEVGTNIVYALPHARSVEHVAGVQGRIVRVGGKAHPVGEVAFGASDHMARAVLTAMRFDPNVRSAANIRFSEEILEIAEVMMLEICQFDRSKEPHGAKTIDWGVAECSKNGVPDLIFDRGGIGKEAMIRLFGGDPVSVAENIIKISARIKRTQLGAGGD